MPNSPFHSGVGVATLSRLLADRAQAHPSREAFRLLDGDAETVLSYGELDRRARAVAARLGLRARGERALLLYPPGLDFIAAFFGCLYAGAVAVPIFPPRRNRGLERLLVIASDARPRWLLSAPSLAQRLEEWMQATPEVADAELVITTARSGDPCEGGPVDLEEDSLAFLQYTSGSTSDPKGVRVTHGNLMANEEAIRRAFGQDAESVVVSWLPVYHDMGLIGGVLQPLYVGARCVLLPPLSFLQRPLSWLRAIDRFRGTTSGGPDFAYSLCCDRISQEERRGLDLSSWRVAFNGSEPVRAATLDRFATAFAGCGFDRRALFPCYGLAEATLFVSGGEVAAPPVIRSVSASGLEEHRVAAPAQEVDARLLVGCGQVAPRHCVEIVDPESRRRCEVEEVGEIWVRGPSVADGYWRGGEICREGFFGHLAEEPQEEPFLRTGDLGFLLDGELFVTGRRKDLIILRGRNHYPQDLELTAERAHPAVQPGGVAAFPVEEEGAERLCLVCEKERRSAAPAEEVAYAVRHRVGDEHEVPVYEVVVVPFGQVPRTTSGKIRRSACRTALQEGALKVLARTGPADAPVIPDTAPDTAATEPSRLAAEPPPDRDELLRLPAASRRPAMESWLRGYLARALRLRLHAVPLDLPLHRLGLDSLAAVDLQGSLAAVLGVEVALDDLLDGASAGMILDRVLASLETPVAARGPLLGRRGDGGPAPLSPGQEGLWVQHRLAPGSAAYHVAAAARLASPVDTGALEWALHRLVDRHAALRTRFQEVDGTPLQVIGPADLAPPDIRLVDARDWDEAALAEYLELEARRPFDLSAGPPVRFRVVDGGGWQAVLLVIHHLLADFWSMGVLARDLGALFRQAVDGAPAALPPLTVDLVDVALWQRERLTGAEGERLAQHWRDRLAGAPAALDLPTDQPRPPLQTFRGRSVRFAWCAGEAEAVHAAAARHATTPFVLLLAAWQALLGRLAGQERLTVGTPFLQRAEPALRPLVGYLVNPVVLLADLSDEPTFTELVERTRLTALDAFAHGAYPFPRLAEELRPQRDPSRPPLFQVLFQWQRAERHDEEALAAFALGAAGARLKLGGLELESLALDLGSAQLELSLSMGSAGDTLAGTLEVNADLFDETTAHRLVGQLRRLLSAALEDPQRRLLDLPLLSPAQRQQVRVEWPVAAGAPVEGHLGIAFRVQAERTPDDVALVWGEQRLTFRDLEVRSRRLALHLRGRGVAPEVRVGVLLERTPDLVVALLAVLRAGGAYVPLDPAYPPGRVAWMLEDSLAGLVVTTPRLAAEAGLPAAAVVDPTAGAAGVGLADLDERAIGDADHLAYLVYTSGSTGRPKAVAIQHRAAATLLEWARHEYAPAERAAVLAATSVCFDLSIFELFLPLTCGGRVVLAENALALPALPAAGEVTLVNTVPSAMAELLRTGGLGRSVRVVNLAGEPFPGAVAAALHRLAHLDRAYNLYGPSEDTTYSTVHRLRRNDPREPAIGRPVSGGCAWVVDRLGTPVPSGVTGELWLAGTGLARGYLGRPSLTADRFTPNPFASLPGDRVYRTGDLARWRADGELEFLGRLDHQVKVRGFRVEPGEVEAVLLGVDGIREAAVVARPGPVGDLRLVAYLAGAGLDPAAGVPPAVGDALAARLPAYMVPSVFVLLDALPRTPNGKLDRKALPEPDWGTGRAAREPPRTALEELVAGLFEELLGVERVGRQDDLFALGGHSLLATRLLARLRDAVGVDLPLTDVFRYPTVRELAARVEGARRIAPAPAVEPVGRQAPLPLSFAQQRLWFLDRLEPGNPFYNVHAAVDLEGELGVRALERALADLQARHEVLRSAFPDHEGQAVQVIAPAARLSLPRLDLEALPASRRRPETRRLAVTAARRPFDLARGNLLRLALLRLERTRHLLLVTTHHVVERRLVDGRVPARAGGRLPRPLARTRPGAADPAGAVRRLRSLATPLVAGAGAGGPVDFLAPAAVRGPARAGAADRPPAPRPAVVPWRPPVPPPGRRAGGAARGPLPAGREHPLHDPPGGARRRCSIATRANAT